MDIKPATLSDLDTVYNIVQTTIKTVYPHYYPKGAVDFFLTHHNRNKIAKDIETGSVMIGYCDKKAIGTVTISEDSICRLFVLPQEQGRGFGGEMLRFAESRIAKKYGTVRLDSSFPAKQIYLKKGYMVIDSRSIETDCGDFLCYDIMVKRVISNEN